MKRTEISFDIGLLPLNLRNYLNKASFYDSSCSENAKTLLVKGTGCMFLKIGKTGALERERRMTTFLHRHRVAPRIIAYESDSDHDYLLSEAVTGEDGVSGEHLRNPVKLASVFGEYLRMLHSLPLEGCPYVNRTAEILKEESDKKTSRELIEQIRSSAEDNVIIHGDYCLPNIVMDHFAFKGFIDLGYGGVGDRHYDLYWGIWTLNYNLKTGEYADIFLDAYGRDVVDLERLSYFTRLIESAD